MVAKKSMLAQMVEAFPFEASDEDLVSALRVYQAKELRTACARLHINPQADPLTNNKDGYIELLRSFRHQRRDGISAAMAGPRKAPDDSTEDRATQHSRFRLANVVFGDALIERMGEMDKIPGREAIDVGAVNANGKYWQDVSRQFSGELPIYGNLVVAREEYEGIRPAERPQLSPGKLEKLWKEIRSLYSTAKTKFSRSGTNEKDFFQFCDGRLDVLYVHDWLQLRPEHGVFVEGILPKKARVNTLRPKRAAETPQREEDSKRRRPASATLEDKIIAILEEDREDANKASVASHAADLGQVIHNGMQVVKDMKEAGVDAASIELVQQKLNPVIAKWLSGMDQIASAELLLQFDRRLAGS